MLLHAPTPQSHEGSQQGRVNPTEYDPRRLEEEMMNALVVEDSPQIAERLANLSVRGDVSPQSQLDQRGLEIFKLMAEGLTNAEIAEKLNLSTKTISNISQSVKEKLGVHRQAYITKLAVKHGLIEP